jgi:hypothetical protein
MNPDVHLSQAMRFIEKWNLDSAESAEKAN